MRPNLFYCFLTAIATLCVSCDSLDQGKVEPPKDTTYTIDLIFDATSAFNVPGAQVYTDISISEYNEYNERVDIKNCSDLKYGDKKIFRANKRSVKLTIFTKFHVIYPTPLVLEYWLAQVYYLEPESNIDITIDNYTNIQTTNPIK